jgi:hypothetical protein
MRTTCPFRRSIRAREPASRDISVFIDAVCAAGAVAALSSPWVNVIQIERKRLRASVVFSDLDERWYEDAVWYDESGRREG